MIDQIIGKLTSDERALFRSFFAIPAFKRVVKENLERLNAQIWAIDTEDKFELNYLSLQYEHLFWNGLNNLIENVEGTPNAPKIQTLD